jgi:hypothetical protein
MKPFWIEYCLARLLEQAPQRIARTAPAEVPIRGLNLQDLQLDRPLNFSLCAQWVIKAIDDAVAGI